MAKAHLSDLIRFSTFFLLFLPGMAFPATLHVGAGFTYPALGAAVAAVQPGDTIEIHAGVYPGGLFFANLKGTAAGWITIRGAAGETVVFQGGGNAIQLSDPAYLHFRHLEFRQQTGNGFNTDDGGTYDTPAHHVIFEDCAFRDMAASGNNDLLKLSGLDDFEVLQCLFQNGAGGGSGIDMVGCHRGLIRGCRFENMGSNAIQCKGGSAYVRIEANYFKNCGQRTLNLGGSTGLQFFRPDTAHYEAAHLQVYSNVISGSVAAVAYVGAVEVEVVNNTIYLPEKWVLRILQETVDPDRFVECGDNTFVNNLVIRNAGLSVETNIGPNTRPQTFIFSNNLWYHLDNPAWAGPSIPVADPMAIINLDPLLYNPVAGDWHIPANSPASGAGAAVTEPVLDYYRQGFAAARSIGAAEGLPVSATSDAEGDNWFRVFPNPFSEQLFFEVPAPLENVRLLVYNIQGQILDHGTAEAVALNAARWPPGIYLVILERFGMRTACFRWVVKY